LIHNDNLYTSNYKKASEPRPQHYAITDVAYFFKSLSLNNSPYSPYLSYGVMESVRSCRRESSII